MHYINAEMPRATVKDMGGEAWKVERLMFAMMFSYCICDLCCPDKPPADRKDMEVFPLLVKSATNSLAQVNRKLRAMTLESSRKRAIIHLFDDIGTSLASVAKAPKTMASKASETKSSASNPSAKSASETERRNRSRVVKPSQASDGTPIRYTITAEEEEVLKADWERHKHAILYSSSEEEGSGYDTVGSEDESEQAKPKPEPAGTRGAKEGTLESMTCSTRYSMRNAVGPDPDPDLGGNFHRISAQEEADQVRHFKITQQYRGKGPFSFELPHPPAPSPVSVIGKAWQDGASVFGADGVEGVHDNIR